MDTLRLTPAPGETLIVEREPGRGPGYLYLHGMGSNRKGDKSEALLAHAIARGRAFTRFDFRGHGESSGAIEQMTITDLIKDAECVLTTTGPSILIGSSLGGLVAAWVAAQHSELVLGLLMIAPALGFMQRMATHERKGPLILVESQWTKIQVHENALVDAARYDESRLPGAILARTLIVHGELDETVPNQVSRDFFARIPHSNKRLWIVPHGDHRLNAFIGEIIALMDQELG